MTREQSIAATLNKAADLIEPEGAWTQGHFARHKNGNPIGPFEDNAACWCASGAIQRIEGRARWGAWDAFDGFIRQRGFDHMATFNDAPGRAQAEVVAALRQAAERVSKRVA